MRTNQAVDEEMPIWAPTDVGMADWQGPIDETWTIERDRRRALVASALDEGRQPGPAADVRAEPPLFDQDPPLAGRTATARATEPGIDAADLVDLVLSPLRTVVPDWLVEGTTIIAAPPKVGKSCLVYQVVVEVAIGGVLFGRRVEPGAALYLALEDGRRRGQARLVAALHGRTMPRGRLEVRWSAKRIGAGLEEDLVAWLDAHPDAAVVAIDTLQRARPATNGKRGAYELDVEDLGRLQAVFKDRRVALIVVHHSRKEAGDDFLASVSGTYGITGSADSTVVIRRKRMEAFGTIVVTGRDIAETELSVQFDGMTWQQAPPSLGEASFERTEIYGVIEAEGPIFPKAIADRLDLERTSVQHMVSALVAKGAVVRMPRGYVAMGRDGGSRAGAYESLPGNSGHSESGASDRGHAHARDEAPVSVGDRTAEIFAQAIVSDEDVEPEDIDDAIAASFPDPAEGATWVN